MKSSRPHAAFFAITTDAAIPPPAMVPIVTTNVAHGPTAVERTAWIW